MDWSAARSEPRSATCTTGMESMSMLMTVGGTVRLSQIADVSMQPKDRSTIAKVDGEECIMLSVNKQSGSNTVKVAQSAVDRLNEVIAENDALQADVVMDQSDYINMTVDNAVQNIWMGVLFAAIVLFLFLRDLGATLSLTIAMPCCILFTFCCATEVMVRL